MEIIILIVILLLAGAWFLQLREEKEDGRELRDILPIYKVEEDCILSKNGDITVAFELTLPEIFSLSRDDYETMHQNWVKAIRLLPKHSVLHKQDWFCRATYEDEDNNYKPSFLSSKAAGYFKGRPYLEHHSYLMLTKKPQGRKLSTSVMNNLMKHSIIPEEVTDKNKFHSFLDTVGQFEKILSEGGFIKLKRLHSEDIIGSKNKPGILEQYLYLLSPNDKPVLKDIELKPEWKIGENFLQLYTLADMENLPAGCSPWVTFDKYSTDKTKFPLGFSASVGHLLSCNHVFNQYIFVNDVSQTLKKMESKRRRLESLSTYSRENAISSEAVNSFLNESISQGRLPVKASFNLMVWTENREEIKDLRGMTSAALAQMDALPKEETRASAPLWWAGLPGNEADFPMNDTFDTFAEQAVCFLNMEGMSKSTSPDKGIRFSDRLTGRPLYLDLYDAPRTEGISANMGTLVCGTSGGGKSMTVNHILRSLYDQGAHCVTVDIGGSYKGLCELVGGYYFTYEEKNPIRFNPFYLPEGEILDTEKKESLKSLLVSLWKQEHESFNRSEYVALSNALTGYYKTLPSISLSPLGERGIFPCFNSFYEYLQDDYKKTLREHHVKDKDFDVDNFLYVLRPYYKNGEFDYLLNATENLDLLNQPFIVFELDNIKDHPILFPVVTLVIMELFISKMRRLQGARKVLTIDEAWKAIAKSGMAEFLKYAFKTIRKFNGIPIVITQELDDLVSSPVIKDAIINNADVKILMDMRKFLNKFGKLQETLGLSDKGKTQVLSVNKDNREIYISIGGQKDIVVKNELCPEEYFAFTTEGKERVKVRTYAEKYGGMEKGIEQLIKAIHQQKS
ncbi:MAG: TraG family conjugative transposon ATPase [Chitinophagaceae bacterium]|nr:MAG: TraG family conjugative transposon ATPase [Chitinophagaceae bacterium]